MGTREAAISRYHQSKWTGKEAVSASGLNWTIFRPSVIYGYGDSFSNLFAGITRKTPIMPVIGGGKALIQPVSVGNVGATFRSGLGSDICIEKT
jgi:uncharacterized protein YbjT (DUF2867 family)